MKKMLLECPNCSAIWGMEEIDWQQCDACGWPNNENDFEDDDWSDDDPDDDDPDNTTFTIDPELLDDFINNYHPVDEKKSVLDQGLPNRLLPDE